MKHLHTRLSTFMMTAGLLAGTAFAQAGSNDPTFNPGDLGFGNGDAFNSWVEDQALQPDGKVIAVGEFTVFSNVPRNHVARLNSDGSLDASFVPSTGVGGGAVIAVALQTDGRILIGGVFTNLPGGYDRLARMNSDGSIDGGYATGTGPNGEVQAIAVQADGRSIIGGGFTAFDGTACGHIVRLNTDGGLDTSFHAGTGTNTSVRCITVQPDGKILIAGSFSTFNGTACNRIARLNADGTRDTTFNPAAGFSDGVESIALRADGKLMAGGGGMVRRLLTDGSSDPSFQTGSGFGSQVYKLVQQPDGKTVVGGHFTMYNGTPLNRIARLNEDGSLDASFAIGSGFNFYVRAITLQADGRLIIGGRFKSYNGVGRNHMARLNSDGSADMTFLLPGSGFNGQVNALVLRPDGRMVVAGAFSSFNGTGTLFMVQLLANGELDPSFQIGDGFDDPLDRGVNVLVLQPDGKVLVGGAFQHVNGTARNRIARLNADGSLDLTFNPGGGFDQPVGGIALQPDGRVLVAGNFSSFNGTARQRIARLNANGTLDASFDPGTGFNDDTGALALLSDGRIIVGGVFSAFQGVPRGRIACLNPDGTLDLSYATGPGFNAAVWALALQPDEKVVAVGSFATYDASTRDRIARLNADGSLDASFTTGTGFVTPSAPAVHCVVVEPDGRLIAGGQFGSYDGQPRSRIVRMLANGALDPSFDPGAGFTNGGPFTFVNALAMQMDGRIVVGGEFTAFNGIGRNRIARLLTGCVAGSTCNDGNVCTTGDVYDADCMCLGTFQDSDGDGTCDANDLCPGGPEPGTICDDGNAGTSLDVITAGCVCQGTPIAQQVMAIAGGRGADAFTICGDGMVSAWGDNADGQLGNGSFTSSNIPLLINSLSGVSAVEAGGDHALALKTDSTVWAWGRNFYGELGIGNNVLHAIPVPVSALSGITAIACGGTHSLALGGDGMVWSWGSNYFHQLGNGSNANSNVPVLVSSLTSVTAIAGGFYHSFALRADSTVWSWGRDFYGELGDGGSNTNSAVPVQVNSLTGITAIAGGFGHSLALRKDSTVWDWGYGLWGQLGNGGNANSNVPVQVSSLAHVIAIAGGGYHSMALKDDGTVWAWGNNYLGQLGNGGNSDSNVPIQVPGLAGVVAIAGGDQFGLALKNDGTLWAWGGNVNGELGHGDNTDSNIPIPAIGPCASAADCQPTQLTTTANPVVSCGATNLKFNGTSTIAANEVPGANKYQFRFTNIPGQPAYARNIAWPTRSFTLTKWYTLPLKAGRTYNVVVRASFDNGATWCDWGTSCTVKISWTPMTPATEPRDMDAVWTGAPELSIYPNPTNGDELNITLSDMDPELTSVSLDITDLFGKQVMNTSLAVQDGELNSALPLTPDLAVGLYVVTITAGEQTFNERLVITR